MTKYHVTSTPKGDVLTLEPALGTWKSIVKTIPVARILRDFVWDKDTSDAFMCPTLDWLSVPEKMQHRGYARKLVAAVFDYMKVHKIPKMMFADFSNGFWQSLNDPRVFFPKKYRGRIGYLLQDPKMKIKAGRETGKGAGMICYCPATGRFLLMKRSTECDYPRTWCGLGGGVEEGEDLDEAVRREAYEEAGFPIDKPCDLKYIGCQKQPGFEFHNYLGLVNEEFEPQLNDEHTDYQWSEWENFPDKMHPLMMGALGSERGQQILNQHTGVQMKINAAKRLNAGDANNTITMPPGLYRVLKTFVIKHGGWIHTFKKEQLLKWGLVNTRVILYLWNDDARDWDIFVPPSGKRKDFAVSDAFSVFQQEYLADGFLRNCRKLTQTGFDAAMADSY